jgi:tripartite-type tricarboxylate transporter receptor subunit TctC
MRWKLRMMQPGSFGAALIGIVCLSVAMLPAAAHAAETYPSRPITILVPFAAGGSSDVVMRLVSKQVSESLGQPIIIENKPGGAGNVAALVIKNAAPDGYTLMMGHTGSHAINATLYPDLKFDPIRDFTPIAPLISFNNVLMVPQESPVTSAAELVALAKSKPAGLTYGSQGVGTGGHLLGVILAARLDLMFASYLTAAPFIESGKLRMLAIAGAKRHPQIPQVPTMGEAGYPEVEMEQWFGVFGPANIPPPVVARLNAEFVKALRSDDVQKILLPQGSVVIPGPPEDLAALVARDIVRLGELVRESGAKPE